jgi:hypothetical protein
MMAPSQKLKGCLRTQCSVASILFENSDYQRQYFIRKQNKLGSVFQKWNQLVSGRIPRCCFFAQRPVRPRRGCANSALLGFVFRDQPAVSMRIGTRLSTVELALLSRSSAAGWTTDSEYLFWAEFP